MSKLVGFDGKFDNLVLVIIFIAVFPSASLQSAGPIATIVNYIWPPALFSYWLITDKKFILNQQDKVSASVGLIFLVFSVFNEGLAVVLFLYLIIRLVIEKKDFLNPYRIGCSLISLLSIINILICPGNHKRALSEMATWFPKFNHLSLFDKILIQLNNISSNLIVHHYILFGLLLILLLLKAVQNKEILPIVLSGIAIALVTIVEKTISKGFGLIYDESSSRTFHINVTKTLFQPSLIFLIILILIATTIFFLYGKSKTSLIFIGSLAVTFASAMATCLSPTLIASSDRPMLFLYFVIIFASAFLANDLINLNQEEIE